nr:rho guanine nucleotide exchange factor 1 isoform X2 [Taeniopygia guttata]
MGPPRPPPSSARRMRTSRTTSNPPPRSRAAPSRAWSCCGSGRWPWRPSCSTSCSSSTPAPWGGDELCYLHAEMMRRMSPKEGRKQFQEFCHLFLDKAGLLRVPVPHHVQFELERSRPELLPEETQRRFLRDVQSLQEPEIRRQLEDFRSKRLMGMTPGEAELAELERGRARDPAGCEARERLLAQGLLARLEEMHPTISSDEEKRERPGRVSASPGPRCGAETPTVLRSGRAKALRAKPRSPSPPIGGSRGGVRGGPPAPPAWGGGPVGTPDPPPGPPPTTAPPPPGGDSTEAETGTDPPGPPELGEPLPEPPPEPPAEEGGAESSDRRRLRIPPRLGRSESLGAPPERRRSQKSGGGLQPPPPRSRSNADLQGPPPTPEPGGPGGGDPPPGGGSEGSVGRVEPELLEQDPPAWRERAAPEALRGLPQREVRRQEVLNELFLTEHAHVRMLRVLLELFYQPMLREGFFDEQELSNIFPSLEDLVEVHTAFLDSLKKLREESGFIIAEIGDVLLARFEGTEGSWFQKISARFCSRQSFALEQLKAKQRKDTRFSQFIQEAESRPRCRRLQLKDIIPTEMQRLTKYPLLLLSITKCTEEAAERSKVQRAAECCRQILNRVNREVRDMENLMKLKDYQRRLDLSGVKQSSDPLLNEFKNTDITKRTLVHEGPLTWRVARDKAVEVQVLLLDDLLVLLQRHEERLLLRCHSRALAPAPDGKRTLSPVIRLRCAMTRQVATDHKAFYVIASWEDGAQIYELVAPSVADRKTWCSIITDAAGSLKLPETLRGKGAQPGGGHGPPAPLDYRDPSENGGGSLKEPLPLDERDKDGAVEGTEFGDPPERGGLGGLPRPPRGPEGGGAGGRRPAER